MENEGFLNLSPDERNQFFEQEYRRFKEKIKKPGPRLHVADGVKSAPLVSLVCASSVTPEPIKWLWPGWIAAGKFHILGGAPGTGKTTIGMRLAATLSAGGTWPDGRPALPGNVIVWSGEDDAADTLAPRLLAANADMSRVFFVADTFDEGRCRAFDPATDIDALRAAIVRAGGASLIVVDPIVSAVSGDSHKNAEVRRALAPLVDMAGNIGAAIIGVTHFSKNTSGREPTERITGSLAFGALARIVMIAAKKTADDDDTPVRIFMRAKSNIGRDDGGFEYSLIERELPAHPGIEASLVDWGQAIEGSARDVLQETETVSDRDAGAVERAAEFLRALLTGGPMAAGDVRREAEASGLSWSSIRRAKKAAGVVSERDGFGSDGEWLWSIDAH